LESVFEKSPLKMQCPFENYFPNPDSKMPKAKAALRRLWTAAV